MKRVFPTLAITILVFACSSTAIFADNTTHTHNWTDWEVEYESTCDEAGYESRYCTECFEDETRELPLAPHEWDSWEVVRKSTPYKSGLKVRECVVCYKEQSKLIAKKKLTSNQKKAQKTVSIYMKAAKSYNVKKMDKCFIKDSKKYGYPSAKYYRNLFKKQNKKINWQFVDVTGKGNSIKVKVKVSHPDFYDQIYKAMYKTIEWALLHQNASDSSIGKHFDNKLRTYINKSKKRTCTDTVTFTVVKTKRGWKLKTKSMYIVDLACGSCNEALSQAEKDFLEDYT